MQRLASTRKWTGRGFIYIVLTISLLLFTITTTGIVITQLVSPGEFTQTGKITPSSNSFDSTADTFNNPNIDRASITGK